jgi:hypothetical protein
MENKAECMGDKCVPLSQGRHLVSYLVYKSNLELSVLDNIQHTTFLIIFVSIYNENMKRSGLLHITCYMLHIKTLRYTSPSQTYIGSHPGPALLEADVETLGG